MGADDARAAIDKAHSAQEAWAHLTARERSNVLWEWHRLILEVQRRSCSDPGSRDGQTPGGGEIGGAACGRLSSVVCRRGEPDLWENDLCTSNDRRMLVIKQPIGVVGAITPWNFPGSTVARKISPALAAGYTVVFEASGAGSFGRGRCRVWRVFLTASSTSSMRRRVTRRAGNCAPIRRLQRSASPARPRAAGC